MKFRALILVALSLLLATPISSFAQSQQKDDLGNVINQVFKGKIPNQGQSQDQGRGQESLSHIDNIPVKVFFDTGAQGLPDNAILIVTAFAAPPANVRRSSPLMLGETRILLNSLRAPLKLVIAAPRAVTDTIDYARIEAKIIDTNGNAIYKISTSGEYRGYEPAIARLVRIGAPQTFPTHPSTDPIRGTITLNSASPAFRGANLVVRLVEDSLAGGQNPIIAAEQKFSLDQKQAPFDFKFDNGISSAHANTPLTFEVWIEDWAGRKTHRLPSPISYNGVSHAYRMRLEVITDNATTNDKYKHTNQRARQSPFQRL